MSDRFFSVTKCDRCSEKLSGRTQSWFNEEVICTICSEEESVIKKKLRTHMGCYFEGCNKGIQELRKITKDLD